MRRLRLFVEGQSEAFFVRDTVAPACSSHGLAVTVQMWTTGRKHSGHPAKGGGVTWDRFRNELTRSLQSDRNAYFSTMIDLYKLNADFPDFAAATHERDPISRAVLLEASIGRTFSEFGDRLIPYIQVHEFESLIFSDASALLHSFPGMQGPVANLARITQPPELINDGELTHPLRRILNEIPTFRKALNGPAVLKSIGLDKLRARCSHFDAWITKLLDLGKET